MLSISENKILERLGCQCLTELSEDRNLPTSRSPGLSRVQYSVRVFIFRRCYCVAEMRWHVMSCGSWHPVRATSEINLLHECNTLCLEVPVHILLWGGCPPVPSPTLRNPNLSSLSFFMDASILTWSFPRIYPLLVKHPFSSSRVCSDGSNRVAHLALFCSPRKI